VVITESYCSAHLNKVRHLERSVDVGVLVDNILSSNIKKNLSLRNA
jgi:hypothetical protein